MSPRRWTRPELLLALHLYERIPFGQQHQSNPQVIELAAALSRTPGSVAMKLNNFTSLDPEERARGVAGLQGASALDHAIWTEFHNEPAVVLESEALWEERFESPAAADDFPSQPHAGPTEATAPRKVRLAQRYFQRAVLANFEHRCALTGIGARELLIASHISPWAGDEANRANPANGLCLNKLHDAAFDKKLLTFDEDFRVVIAGRLQTRLGEGPLPSALLAYQGRRLAQPVRRAISPAFMEQHRAAFLELERA